MTLATIRDDIDARGDLHAEAKRLRCRLAAVEVQLTGISSADKAKADLAASRKQAAKYQQERDTARARCGDLEALLERMGARRNAKGAFLIDAPVRKPRELTEASRLRADLTAERAKCADLARALRVVGAAPQLDRILAKYAEAKADDPGDR